ncbi:MAG: protein kinase, partial [Vicinamibacterales bacterium]
MERDPLIETANRVAAFEPVDWPALELASSEAQRELLRELSVLARIADAHRQFHDLLPPLERPAEGGSRSRWGHLELLEQIGQGASGTVYRALDTRLHREVALKLYPASADVLRVIEEGRRLARVRHPNVVLVFGADIHSRVPGLWMELVRGRSLDAVVRQDGPFGADEASVIGRDLARALAALHGVGLVHRDVKAQNVVRESGGRIVLMDLGASSGPAGPCADSADGLIGTPLYMAPERLEGAPATVQSDLYALGVLLYFLTTGSMPVTAASLTDLREAHRRHRSRALVDARPDVPPGFAAIVSGLLQADPANRPGSAGEVEERLTAAIAARSPDRPARRPVSWKGSLIAAVAAILVGAFLWPLLPARPGADGVQGGPIRLAVMPIRNLTGDPAKDYLAQGLTELLVAQLARLKGLQIPASEGLARFRDKADPEVVAGARQLGARLMLAGSVVQADQRVRLNVRLTDLVTLDVLWGTEIVRAPA